MKLLTREEFYKRLGHVLRRAREKRGLSREQLAAQLNQMPIDPERHLRHVAALSIMAGHIRRKKGLTRKQVAERANLPVEFIRDLEAGKIWNPEIYAIYCLAYGLRTSFSAFEKRVDVLSHTELDEHDRPIRNKKKYMLPRARSSDLSEAGSNTAADTTSDREPKLGGSDPESTDGTDHS
jgi:transcriptional regulator with XRE-family HTH domain